MTFACYAPSSTSTAQTADLGDQELKNNPTLSAFALALTMFFKRVKRVIKR